MSRSRKMGVEEARANLPQLVKEAEKGRSTVITKYGLPLAAIVPLSAYMAVKREEPSTAAAGSGRGRRGSAKGRVRPKPRGKLSR